MARNLIERRLLGWLAYLAYDPRVADSFRRHAGHLRRDCIERACAAFNLNPASATDLSLLLGIMADILFPTYDLRPDAPPEYRQPKPPLVSIWISGRAEKAALANSECIPISLPEKT
jgi:hypothetical protein